MRLEMSSFLDEMRKVAVKLNPEEERERALKYMAVGTVAGIPISGIGGLIRGGPPGWSWVQNMTNNAGSIPRWMLGGAAMGAAYGGLIPLIQRKISDSMNAKAIQRVQWEKVQSQLGKPPMVGGLPIGS